MPKSTWQDLVTASKIWPMPNLFIKSVLTNVSRNITPDVSFFSLIFVSSSVVSFLNNITQSSVSRLYHLQKEAWSSRQRQTNVSNYQGCKSLLKNCGVTSPPHPPPILSFPLSSYVPLSVPLKRGGGWGPSRTLLKILHCCRSVWAHFRWKKIDLLCRVPSWETVEN